MDYTSFILDNPPDDVNQLILIDVDHSDRSILWKDYASIVRGVAAGLRSVGVR
ncbi:hypothetical protein Slin14017_G066750 [Septoria linicola]|nr:hypothetical protein Slin14017_G066750 [Septoria linicola]